MQANNKKQKQAHASADSVWYTFKICEGIRYDTIKQFNVDSKAEFDQLNVAHKTKKQLSVPLSSVQVKGP